MKKPKKFLSVILIITLCSSMLSGCGKDSSNNPKKNNNSETNDNIQSNNKQNNNTQNSEDNININQPENSNLPQMTTEEITLTYVHFDNEDLVEFLAEKFMSKYPNIKVNLKYHEADKKYNKALQSMISKGEVPDCFMILDDCDFALDNDLLKDMTTYWENDPENQNILPTINEAKMGYYGTDTKYATPMRFFPDVIYADMAVFKNQNVKMPPKDWTWDEMIQAIKDITSTNDGIYGFNQFHSLITYYPIASDPNCIGEFGWDGASFHMENWVIGVQQWLELVNGKYHAPYIDTDENEAWLGDRTAMAVNSGKIGFQLDTWESYLNLFNTADYRSKGIEMVPYTIPVVESSGSKNVFGVLDFGGISSKTQHSREAYELLKWMGWGIEGWKYKLEAYKNMLSSDGIPIYMQSMPCPITLDEDIWNDFRQSFYPTQNRTQNAIKDPKDNKELVTKKEDKKYGKYFDSFFEKCINVIPSGNTQIPGFAAFINEIYSDVEVSICKEGKKAADYIVYLEEKANKYNKQAMETIFG